MTDRTLGHRAPLLWLVLPFMAGLSAGHMGPAITIGSSLPLALGAAAVAVALSRRAPAAALAALCVSMLLAGDASYLMHRHRLPSWEGRRASWVHVSMRVGKVYEQASPGKAGGLAVVTRAGGGLGELTGQRIYYSLAVRDGRGAPGRSEVVAAAGLLTPLPRDAPADSFNGSLAAQGLNFRLTRGRLLSRLEPAPAYDRLFERLAVRMSDRLGRGLERHPDLAAMYRAMMLGRKGGLTPAQKLLFMHGGVMHLFAINGLHIGMVAMALHALLALARCPRPLAALLVLGILWLDVETTGASPSAVRAFLMVAVLEAARVLRCPCNPLAALAASALPVLLANPMDYFSASFRMSYAVVGGILAFGLPFSARMGRRFAPYRYLPEVSWTRRQRLLARVVDHLLQASGIGIAAALVGAVTGIEFFGVVTPMGLLGNLVLVPLASLVIVAGCLCLVAPDIGIHAPLLFNHAAGLLLGAIEELLRLASRVPLAWIPAHYRAGWIGPASLASLMAAFVWGYAHGWRRERGGWWPPVAIVLLTLAAGVRFG